MQWKMAVTEVKGITPGQKFENALKTVVSLPREKAEQVRHHTLKTRS